MTDKADLLALLRAKGLDVVPDFTGVPTRGGHNNRYWFVGNEHVTASGAVHYFANFGDWRTGEEWTWESDIPLDATEAEALRAAMDAQKKKMREDKEANQEEVSQQACVFLANNCITKGYSPYLEKKGYKPGELFGALLFAEQDTTFTVVPYRDISGKIWGFQTISDGGEKRFLPGARISGNFFQIGETTKEAYLCEGFATGAAIASVANKVVFVAFNSGNLIQVAKALKAAYPSMQVTLVADNDRNTEGNPGVAAASEVLMESYVLRVCVPEFKNKESKGTDANDLLVEEGTESVANLLANSFEDFRTIQKKYLSAAHSTPSTQVAGGGGLDPLPRTKKKKLSELYMANMVLSEIGDTLLVQGEEDLWMWTGTHWRLAEPTQENIVKNMFTQYDPELGSGAVDSAYRTLLRIAPRAKRDMFSPLSNVQAFQDGTVRVEKSKDGESKLVFRPGHNPLDMCTTYLDFNWCTDESKTNELFEQTLDAAFKNDPDKDQKILEIQEFAGAMLFPSHSRIMFFVGVHGSNKSTIGLTLLNMLPQEVLTALDPCEMEGFMKETMINKLINYNLDMDEGKKFPVAMAKRLLDRTPEMVNRKNKKAVPALLPGMHLYAANSLPPNFEKTIGPLVRRVSIVQFKCHAGVNQDGTVKAGTKKDYWEIILGVHADPAERTRLREGLLNFMKKGLYRLLLQGGFYTQGEASKRAINDWQKEYNAILQFMDDINQGEATFGGSKICLDPEGKMPRTKLFEVFQEWLKISAIPDNRFSRHSFYKKMREAGFAETKDDFGEVHFVGFRMGSKSNAVA